MVRAFDSDKPRLLLLLDLFANHWSHFSACTESIVERLPEVRLPCVDSDTPQLGDMLYVRSVFHPHFPSLPLQYVDLPAVVLKNTALLRALNVHCELNVASLRR